MAKTRRSKTTSTCSSRKTDTAVLTPGGWRSSSKVHHVPPGYEVSGAGGRLRIVNRATGEVLEDLGEIKTARAKPRKKR
jgi:hypothetical protein